MLLNMRCEPTILRTWADNYLEASPRQGCAPRLHPSCGGVHAGIEDTLPSDSSADACPFDLAAGTQDGDPEPHQPGPRAHAGEAARAGVRSVGCPDPAASPPLLLFFTPVELPWDFELDKRLLHLVVHIKRSQEEDSWWQR